MNFQLLKIEYLLYQNDMKLQLKKIVNDRTGMIIHKIIIRDSNHNI